MNRRERWVENIHKFATGQIKTRSYTAPLAGTIFFAIIIIFVYGSLWLDGLLWLPELLHKPWALIAGVPITLAGLFLIMWSVFTFAELKGTPVPIKPPPILVLAGPYAYYRNPMMSGLFVIIFGVGLLAGSVMVTLVFLPLFIAGMVAQIKLIEEPELEKRLGNDYSEYRKRTPMFFPRPW